jgi:protein SCO1/2
MHAAPRMRENQERSPFTPALGTGTLDRMRPFLLLRLLAVWLIASTVGCRDSHVREYELRGQVVAIDPARLEITIKHEDIPRFMPGMTMPFKVKEPGLLEGRVPGDLVRATLVVEDEGAHLRTIERTGSAPLAEAPVAAGSADALLNEGDVVPDAAFVDATGTSRRLSEWRGQALAVTFIYTRCPFPDFCPLMDRQFQAAQRTLASDDALGSRARLLSVSIDPGHDRPPVLRDHARRVGADPARWTFLTGRPEDIQAFAWQFGLSVVREGDATEIVHNLRTVVLDGEGRLATVLRGNEWTPDDLIGALRKAADGRR